MGHGAWAGWAGWARVGNRSDWAAEPLRWVPPEPAQLNMYLRLGRLALPTFCCGLQALPGYLGIVYDGANQFFDSPGLLDQVC